MTRPPTGSAIVSDVELRFQALELMDRPAEGGYAILPLDPVWDPAPALGIDSQGRWCLLAEDAEADPDERRERAGLSFRVIDLDQRRTVLMSCKIPALNGLFARVVADVLRYAGSARPAEVCSTIVDKWLRFFSPLGRGPSAEILTGAWGELALLEHLLDKGVADAWSWWAGPSGAPHDFVAPALALEVKTTLSDVWIVHVNGLGQLESGPFEDLYLVVQRAVRNASGRSIADLRESLGARGVPVVDIDYKLAALGVLPIESDEPEFRLTLRDRRILLIDDAYPRPRPSMLAPEVSQKVTRLTYCLDVSGEPGPVDERALIEALAKRSAL